MKVHKQHDKDATTARAKKALKEYVAVHGFKHLTATVIADLLDVSLSTITRLAIGGLAGVVKETIKETDCWPSFFEKFSLPTYAKAWKKLMMFIEMMQGCFDEFFASADMQHAILGQISVESEVLREVSEAREQKGALLLGLTDGHFTGSGVSFRAVMALLLGGIYYLVLHARYNKSTVCGIDINKEQDFKQVRETVAYILELVWQDGGKKRKAYKRQQQRAHYASAA